MVRLNRIGLLPRFLIIFFFLFSFFFFLFFFFFFLFFFFFSFLFSLRTYCLFSCFPLSFCLAEILSFFKTLASDTLGFIPVNFVKILSLFKIQVFFLFLFLFLPRISLIFLLKYSSSLFFLSLLSLFSLSLLSPLSRQEELEKDHGEKILLFQLLPFLLLLTLSLSLSLQTRPPLPSLLKEREEREKKREGKRRRRRNMGRFRRV